MKTLSLISWDTGEDFEVYKLQEALEVFGLEVCEIDTGSSMYAVVIGRKPLAQETAEKFFWDSEEIDT